MVLFVVNKSPVVYRLVNLLRDPKKKTLTGKKNNQVLYLPLWVESQASCVMLLLRADWTNSLFTGSKSDGQRSPNDTVFLRMDEIPYIHEDRPENCGEDGERC